MFQQPNARVGYLDVTFLVVFDVLTWIRILDHLLTWVRVEFTQKHYFGFYCIVSHVIFHSVQSIDVFIVHAKNVIEGLEINVLHILSMVFDWDFISLQNRLDKTGWFLIQLRSTCDKNNSNE